MIDPLSLRHAGPVSPSSATNAPLLGSGLRRRAGVTVGLVFGLLLAACGGGEEAGNNGSAGEGQVIEQTPVNLQDDPTNSVVPLTAPGAPPTASPSPIAALPAEFQGRWGMVPNDCVPGRDDAKGLMTVSADTLAFYESRGRIEQAAVLRPGTIRLDLAFAGEGQEWARQTTLTLLHDGRTLVAETPADPEPPMRSLRYFRCPA